MENRSYWKKKILEVILTLLVVTLLSFLLMRLSPIDPATAYVTRNTPIVTAEQIQEARVKLGLDQPLLVQYGQWVFKACQLDLGISLASGRSVTTEIGKALPVSLAVVLLSGLIMGLGSIMVGSLHYFLWDHWLGLVLSLVAILGLSIPAFYLASLFLDVFAVRIGGLNVSGNTGIMRYFPAALCLSVSGIAFYSQMIAGNLKKEMNEDYAFYARCRGLKEGRILFFHALPHGIMRLLPSFMQTLGLCLAGAVIVERVFSLPGLGYLLIDSVMKRDSPVIHVVVLILALALIISNIFADLIKKGLKEDFSKVEVL